jgi:hypothetical protein
MPEQLERERTAMMKRERNSTKALYTALVAFLLMGLLSVPGSAPGATLAQPEVPEIGPVEALALDAAGNGWAWAGPPPQILLNNYLLRIENGSSRVAFSSENNPNILPAGTRLTKIVLSERGDTGWAIGTTLRTPTADIHQRVIMRLSAGRWSVYDTNIPTSTILYDITIAPDDTDGWMTGYDNRVDVYRLFRLRNGSWQGVSLPASGGALERVALSPDGRQGVAVGPRNRANDIFAPHAMYRLVSGRWEVVAGELYNENYIPVSITADNAGNGWVVNQFQHELYASRVITSPIRSDAVMRSFLYRLPRTGAPSAVDLQLMSSPAYPDAEFYFNSVSVDANGRGWAAGSFFAGIDNSNPPESINLFVPVLFRLQGETAQRIDPGVVDYGRAHNQKPLALHVARNGAHTWVGAHDGIGFGYLQEIREVWLHQRPPITNPLPGTGVCFAAVPHCLRGVFATYWQTKGGLDLFGYPITPEVRETIGGKEYVVQYTQRARFEYHPENPAPNNVLLGLLGNTLAEPRLNEDPFTPKPPGIVPSAEWFQQTQHNVRPPFIDYWRSNGGLPVFGLPRSEAFEERNEADGKTYLVQYFERNRLEYHPEQTDPKFQMLLGLLGTEQFRKTYGYTP